jgi:HEAT repeat protein
VRFEFNKKMKKDKRKLIYAVIAMGYMAVWGSNVRAAGDDTAVLGRLDNILTRMAQYDYGRDAAAVDELSEWIRTRPAAGLNAAAEDRMIAFIKTNASTAAKRYVCEQLSIIGTERSAPALAAMLADPATSDIARYALERIPGPAVDAALWDAMKQTGGKTGAGIINTVANRHIEAAVPMLEATASMCSDPQIVEAAIRALGCIGNESCGKILIEKLMPKQEGPFRQMVLPACLMCAERLARDGHSDLALEIYRKLYTPDNPSNFRIAALIGMIRTNPRQGMELIQAAMGDKDATVGAAAVAQLRELPGQGIDEVVADWLPSAPNYLQPQLITVLADRRKPSSLAAVRRAVENPDLAVSEAALLALGKLGDASCVPLLAKYAAGPSGRTATAARDSLDRIVGAGAEGAVLSGIEQTTEPGPKIELIRAAARRGAAQAVPILMKTAKADNPGVRIESLKALRILATGNEVEGLVDLTLGAANRTEEKEATKTLVAAAKTITPPEAQADAILNRLSGLKETRPRIVLFDALGQLGNAKALPTLQAAIKDPDAGVCDTAIRTLAGWPTLEPAETLLQIAKQGQNSSHRILALRGYIRLAGLEEKQPQAAVTMYQQALTATERVDEHKLIIAGLANLGTVETLPIFLTELKESALRGEAAAGILAVCEKVEDRHPEEVKHAVETLLAATHDPSITSRAEALLNFEYITAWEIVGPFRQAGMTGTQLLDLKFPPEQTDGPKVEWSPLPEQTDPARFWYVNLAGALPGDQSAGYVRTWFWMPREKEIVLSFGCDGGYKIWLNRELCRQANTPAPCTPGQYAIEVDAAQGWNELLIKVGHETGPLGLSARLHDKTGRKIEGLKVSVRPEMGIDPH